MVLGTLVLFVLAVCVFGAHVVRKRREREREKVERARVLAERRAQADELLRADKLKKDAKIAAGKRVFSPNPGLVWNPLKGYPRNSHCICGSGQKFKRCCLPKIPDAVPKEQATETQRLLAKAMARGIDMSKIAARVHRSPHPAGRG